MPETPQWGIWWPSPSEPFPPGFSGAGGIFERVAESADAAVTAAAARTSDVTVGVPGDYPTVQAAIDDLSGRPAAQGVTITVTIEAGHVVDGGLFWVENGDYSHFIISSQDAEVVADAGNTGDQTIFGTAGSFAVVENAVGPQWDVLIDAQQSGPADAKGITVRGANAAMKIHRGKGLTNLGDRAVIGGPEPTQYGYGLCVARGATVDMIEAVITGSAGRNVWATRLSRVNAALANISGALGQNGTDPQDSANHGNLYATRGAWVNIGAGADCTGAVNRGITARRSFVNAQLADVSGCGGTGFYADLGSTIVAADAVAENCGNRAFDVRAGSKIVADRAAAASATSDAANVAQAEFYATDADLSGAGGRAVQVFGGSAYLHNADLSGATDDAIDVRDGYATMRGANVTGSGAIRCREGAIIVANGVTGSPSFTKSPNTLDSDGIIFN